MKTYNILVVLILSFKLSHAQFNFVGLASQIGTNSFTLVPTGVNNNDCGTFRNGAMWSNTVIDFRRSFVLNFQLNFTAIPLSGTGDGCALIFGTDIQNTSIGGTGGHLGYYATNHVPFDKSIGIEFDIYNNSAFGDIPGPHIMIARNADPANILFPSVPINSGVVDGAFHQYSVRWNCDTRELQVFFDTRILVDTVFHPDAIFSDFRNVRWGFTAGRAVACAEILLRNISLRVGNNCACVDALIENQSHISGGHQFTGHLIGGANLNTFPLPVYTWNFGDGTAEVTTSIPTVLHTYSTPGNYFVSLRTVGYNVSTDECCRETTAIEVQGLAAKPAAILELNNNPKGNVTISPNPSNGSFRITSIISFSGISVYDLTGRTVYTQTTKAKKNATVEAMELPEGIYIIELKNNSDIVFRGKIMIE